MKKQAILNTFSEIGKKKGKREKAIRFTTRNIAHWFRNDDFPTLKFWPEVEAKYQKIKRKKFELEKSRDS